MLINSCLHEKDYFWSLVLICGRVNRLPAHLPHEQLLKMISERQAQG